MRKKIVKEVSEKDIEGFIVNVASHHQESAQDAQEDCDPDMMVNPIAAHNIKMASKKANKGVDKSKQAIRERVKRANDARNHVL